LVIGTIASEFACYSFDDLAAMPAKKLRVLYNEAIRQRTSKANFLALLINRPNQTEETQEKVNKIVDGYLDPYKIVGLDTSGWDAMRASRR
jgi:hypothetical protein